MNKRYEWDPVKADRNLSENRPDTRPRFEDIERFDWNTAIIIPDERSDYQEERFTALGMIGERLHICVFTPRGTALRIISLRKANDRERKRYERARNNNAG